MLRTRLRYALFTLVILLWAVSAAGLMLLNDAGERVQSELRANYSVVADAHNFRVACSVLNNYYLTTLAEPQGERPLDRVLFDETRRRIEQRLEGVAAVAVGRPRWEEVVARFRAVLEQYFEGYEGLIRGDVVGRQDRSDLLKAMGGLTQRITDLSENLASLAEERLFAAADALSKEKTKNTLFILTLAGLGTAIAGLIYYQLVRQLVDPVAGLKHSIDEVKRGNFEMTVSVPTRDSEFASLATAFNEMAAELRLRRRETDESLLRNTLVNRALLAAIPSPVYVISEDGEIVQLNPAAEDLNDKLGISPRLPKKVARLLESCRQRDSSLLPEDPREALLFRIDEREFYFLPRIFRFSSELDEHTGWAILLHDVSRIRWLDDMKTNMLSTVSHEIKTPLTGIRMVLHLLLEENAGTLSEMQRTMLASANDDCERLLETLKQLLDLSRAESGAPQLDRRAVDLLELAQQSVSLFRPQAGARGIRFRVATEDDLPPVFADNLRLSEVINNLVSNAVKHTPDNSEVVVEIARHGSEFLRLCVSDEGAGIPEEFQDRIFERFFRAPGQKTDGVGLGLFICREIMRAHEGRIGVKERNEEQPTVFFVDVPLA